MEIEDIPKWLKQVAIGGALAGGAGAYLLYKELSKVKPHDYIRFENNALEIAVKTFYHAGQDVSIDLAGAIHIADNSFFTDVKDHLDSLDVVLFEAVKPDKTKQPSEHMKLLKRMYTIMANELDLGQQMGVIDYENLPDNWEHCDMDEAEIAKHGGLMYNNKLTGNPNFKELIRVVNKALDEFEQELNNRRTTTGGMLTKYKPRLAEGFAYDTDSKLVKKIQFMIPELILGKGVILEKRNGVVNDRLEELTVDAEEPLHVGVFYGAAHLPGIEEYLVEELGYELTEEKWIPAWQV